MYEHNIILSVIRWSFQAKTHAITCMRFLFQLRPTSYPSTRRIPQGGASCCCSSRCCRRCCYCRPAMIKCFPATKRKVFKSVQGKTAAQSICNVGLSMSKCQWYTSSFQGYLNVCVRVPFINLCYSVSRCYVYNFRGSVSMWPCQRGRIKWRAINDPARFV